MRRKVTITYEIECGSGALPEIDALIHHGLGPIKCVVRDGTLSVERLDDCPVHDAATAANAGRAAQPQPSEDRAQAAELEAARPALVAALREDLRRDYPMPGEKKR